MALDPAVLKARIDLRVCELKLARRPRLQRACAAV